MGSGGKSRAGSFTEGFEEDPQKWQKMSELAYLSTFWDNFKISDTMGYNKPKQVTCES